MAPPPPDGVLVLTDVDNPLLGPRGAAAVFGPEKGASPREVAVIERALTSWAELLGADPQAPGGGAAGGTAAGLATVWGAELTSGSAWIAEQVGLDDAVRWADVVVTGEGRFDTTSLGGKAVGLVLSAARRHGRQAVVVAGSVDHAARVAVPTVEVAKLAGSSSAAMSSATEWITAAGSAAAKGCPPLPRTSPGRPAVP
jgi:glycerate kinase